MLVQEYTCSLCGLSSKDFLVLKKHMKDAHGKDIGHGIFSHGPKENKSVSIRGDDNEATPEKESSKETNWQKPEELLSHLPKDTKNAFDKMLMTGLTRCMFCGKENTDLNDMVAHVMKEHGNEIEKMKGNLEFMPSSQDMNELLGNLGNITSMLIGQLGGAMENGDGESMKKMFTAMIPDEDTPDGVSHWTSGDLSSEEDPNISGDGDMPDIDGIMEIALERLFPKGLVYEHHLRWHDGNGHSHVRASMLGPSLTVPFNKKKMLLGKWQQIIFCELDVRPRDRTVFLQIIGE